MNAETFGSGRPRPGTSQAERAPRALRILGMAAVCIGLAALVGGTFVLSYSGIHALALHAGIAPRLARGYPLLVDAMLVVVLAAVLALRGADLPSRFLAWTTLLAVLAAAAGADALHAVGRRLPRHVGAITAAVLPWVLLFLAFALLLAMLRHARLRRLAAAGGLPTAHADALAGSLTAGQHEDPQPSATGAAAILPGLELPVRQLDADKVEQAGQVEQVEQVEQAAQAAQVEHDDEVDEADDTGARPDRVEQANRDGQPDEQDDPDMPVFHRMWSLPGTPEPSA